MKKILLGLLTITAIGHAKEVTPAPLVVEEVKPVVEEEIYVAGASKRDWKGKYNLYVRAGADVYSQFNEVEYNGIDLGGKASKGTGYEVALELTKMSVNKDVEVGFGVGYQKHGKFKSVNGFVDIEGDIFGYNSNLDTFESFPIYVTAKYNFLNFENGIIPYIKGDAGYAINRGNSGKIYMEDFFVEETDVEDGGYFGLGAGVEYENFFIDAMYKLNTGKLENKNDDISEKLRNYRVTLSMGYKFNF